MKQILYSIFFIFLLSCSKGKDANENATDTAAIITVSERNTDIGTIENIQRPNKSQIKNPAFDTALLFGIWTDDQDAPHADFEINKQYFYVADYDGNGEMPYVINGNSLKVYYNDFLSTGVVSKVSKDSLFVNWDGDGVVKYSRWKQ